MRTTHDCFLAAINMLVRERKRQVYSEGHTPAKDDAFTAGELADAAAAYACAGAILAEYGPQDGGVQLEDYGRLGLAWPWAPAAFKAPNQKAALVKAGGLIIAELERVLRAERGGELAPTQFNKAKGDEHGTRG